MANILLKKEERMNRGALILLSILWLIAYVFLKSDTQMIISNMFVGLSFLAKD